MTKQKTYTLPIMRPPTRLRQSGTNIHNLQHRTPLLLPTQRHRIRNHNPTQPTRIQRPYSLSAQNPMRDNRHHFGRALVDERLGRFDQGAARVGHVVDDDGDFGRDGADEGHGGDFVGPFALFVDDGEGAVEFVRN